MIARSSSARNPIDSTFNSPAPTGRWSGIILPLRASMPPSMPSRRGTEKPQMSASSTPMVSPRRASATARFTVTDDFPTPPFPDPTARILVVASIPVSGAFWRAFHRARPPGGGGGAHPPHPDLGGGPPGEANGGGGDVMFELAPKRAASDGQRDT